MTRFVQTLLKCFLINKINLLNKKLRYHSYFFFLSFLVFWSSFYTYYIEQEWRMALGLCAHVIPPLIYVKVILFSKFELNIFSLYFVTLMI